MLKLKRAWFVVTGWLALWPLWCKVYQWIWERDLVKQYDIAFWRHMKPAEVANNLLIFKWQPDGWREAWDAAHHPEWVGHAGSLIVDANSYAIKHASDPDNPFASMTPGIGQPKGSMDCEDFALAAAWALKPEYDARVLCIFWSTGWWPWKTMGHAVCIYRTGELWNASWGYLGNWPHVSGLGDVFDVEEDILKKVGRTRSDLVATRFYRPEDLMLRYL